MYCAMCRKRKLIIQVRKTTKNKIEYDVSATRYYYLKAMPIFWHREHSLKPEESKKVFSLFNYEDLSINCGILLSASGSGIECSYSYNFLIPSVIHHNNSKKSEVAHQIPWWFFRQWGWILHVHTSWYYTQTSCQSLYSVKYDKVYPIGSSKTFLLIL